MNPASQPSLDWHAGALQAALAPHCPGLTVQLVATVDSTNTRLLEECRTQPTPMRGAVLLIAEHQRGGRGRQGRVWISEPGASLTFSLAWPLRRAEPSGLSLVVGVVLAEALDPAERGVPRIGLKWPNDLWLLDAEPGPGSAARYAERALGRKLGGILIETVSQANERVAVIGIGLNVLPLEVPTPSSGFACLRELDAAMTAPLALSRIAVPLVQALRAYEDAGFAGFEARYRARDLLLGRMVQAGVLSGCADGVADNGALRLRAAAGLHHVVSGEVSIRLQPPAAVPSSTAC